LIRRRLYHNPWTLFILVVTGLSLVYIGGCRRAGNWLVKDEIAGQADAMVLLMGSFPPRVLQAIDIYNEGRTRRIIIVNEYRGPYKMLTDKGVEVIGTTAQALNALVTLGIPPDSITILPGEAQSTLTEVMVTVDYLSKHPEIRSLIIVSSPSHMRRSGLIFRKAIKFSGLDVTIGYSPSKYTGFNPGQWWKSKEDIQIVLSEYLKLTSFVLFENRTLKEHFQPN
jgi:uncharacterized SAM-binding protein YcdF (DUF218 family)